MRPSSSLVAAGLAAILFVPTLLAADPPKSEKVALADGDRVVFLGNTFAERDARYGYLETRLTADNPDKSIVFRNLGWSGDTVWGDARARFGTRADGFQHLKEHVLALKPTLILVAYGMNESFAGEAGLTDFEKGLNALLDTLAETKARIVLISPNAHEDLGPPLPSPERHNLDLKQYCRVLEQVARSRGYAFIDVYQFHMKSMLHATPDKIARMTDDGIHLTDQGYMILTEEILAAFRRDSGGADSGPWLVKLKGAEVSKAFRVTVSDLTAGAKGLRFQGVARDNSTGSGAVVSDLLKSGETYSIKVDGKVVGISVAEDSIPEGARCSWGVDPGQGIRWERVREHKSRREQLRAAINKKNGLYFNRWRPQNETYLFGFRKHEQGNNGREIPLFDPLVAEMEAEIARLKKPALQAHIYELIREEAAK